MKPRNCGSESSRQGRRACERAQAMPGISYEMAEKARTGREFAALGIWDPIPGARTVNSAFSEGISSLLKTTAKNSAIRIIGIFMWAFKWTATRIAVLPALLSKCFKLCRLLDWLRAVMMLMTQLAHGHIY